ncbi:MAG: glucoamylase family protein [Gemmataceae bacterium]
MTADKGPLTDEELEGIQFTTVQYYLHEINPYNGLVRDKTFPDAPASIAACGMALATMPLFVERLLLPRTNIAQRVRNHLRYLWELPQGPEPDASGHHGFFYHFLHMGTGERVWNCELSTIDSAFLFAGILTCATYFDADDPIENDLRAYATKLYERVDWNWACNGGAAVTHGWRPESGFIPHSWTGYDEALILNLLGLGSPTHPLPAESYSAYTSTYKWGNVYGHEYLVCPPLFTYQLSHMWVDFRGIRDAVMRERGMDYFENSRRATYGHRAYCIANPNEFIGYGENCWGITACDGPGWEKKLAKNGREVQFFDYIARGVPEGPDDGTIAPWAVVASLPFAPEIVMPTIRHFESLDLGMLQPFGFKASFNRTYPGTTGPLGWVTPHHFGIDQGPIALMIENYRSEFLWNLMRRCKPLVAGLRRAGFTGGWLDG